MKKTFSDFRSMLSGSLGNAMEWYDFAVYGYFAKVLAPLFFPTEDKTAALISVFGVFAAGYVMRPIGALIFGRIGDKLGRKKALLLSVLVMIIATSLLGLLPTHASVGIMAPILLTILRLIQGISVGGEFTTSITFVSEMAPSNRRGFYTSWSTVSVIGGILVGSAIGAIVENVFTPEQISAWGWRIPFLLSIVMGLGIYKLREKITESQAFIKNKESGHIPKHPMLIALKYHYKKMLLIFGLLWVFSVSFYMPFIYLPTYENTEVGIALSKSLEINTIALILLLGLILITGNLTDKIGRKKVLAIGIIGYLLFSYPMFLLITSGNIFSVFIAVAAMAFITSFLQGSIPAFLSESFDSNIRVSALSFSCNAALAVFGGTTPLVATDLIQITNNPMAPAWYLVVAAAVSLVCLFFLKETMGTKDSP